MFEQPRICYCSLYKLYKSRLGGKTLLFLLDRIEGQSETWRSHMLLPFIALIGW